MANIQMRTRAGNARKSIDGKWIEEHTCVVVVVPSKSVDVPTNFTQINNVPDLKRPCHWGRVRKEMMKSVCLTRLIEIGI